MHRISETMAFEMIKKIWSVYVASLRIIVYVMVVGSGLGIFTMIGVTCADVVLRRFGTALVGAYDIVKISGALTLAFALPYTTAVKGHVAIEYFFHKLGRGKRIFVDSVLRSMSMALFGFLGYRSFVYGGEFLGNKQVSQTLEIPVFWVPWVIGVCCFAVMLVIAHNLIRPEREMIKP